ncbi:hypothetical protein AB6N01_18845 [Alcaligenes nematophilus]|uniref:Uncharacterized protein n=1 Tax=Alcaligenes phenolicus TaxID=232846 RepID=A0ABV2BIJ0_9BURK
MKIKYIRFDAVIQGNSKQDAGIKKASLMSWLFY